MVAGSVSFLRIFPRIVDSGINLFPTALLFLKNLLIGFIFTNQWYFLSFSMHIHILLFLLFCEQIVEIQYMEINKFMQPEQVYKTSLVQQMYSNISQLFIH